MKVYKVIISLDEAGWHKVKVEIEGGFDEAGFYEEKVKPIEVKHL
jgi:hypothetical protein